MKFVMFSKHLQELSIVDAARRAQKIGFAGLDLTVREGGHITPENAKTELPAAKKALDDMGLDIPMLTTNISSVDSPHARDIMGTAKALGIHDLKLGYWPYKPFGRIHEQLDDVRRKLDGIEKLAGEIGVRMCIHTHSGNTLSAVEAVVYMMLKDRDPKCVGAYVDPMHMTVEGGNSGWQQGLDLVQDYIALMSVKSAGWFRTDNPETGEASWRAKLVPVHQGTVRWREFLACMKHVGFDGTVTFHSEYQGGGSWKDLSLEELIAQTKADFTYLRPLFKEAGLG